MTSALAGPRRRSPETFTIPVVIAGLLVASAQGLMSVSRVLAVWVFDVPVEEAAIQVGRDEYVRAAVRSLPNVGLCLLALTATILAISSHSRRGQRLPWACLGVIAVVAVLTALRLPTWPGGQV